jgi:diguanylate cyclase (GGDEF)-like protein
MSGLVVDGNDTWARQMGYPIEEMRGRALRDLFVPGTEPLALMRFRVDDGLGHDVGDRLLVRVADRLREALTAPGTLLARLGGDEFGVVVDGTHGATAAEQAQLVLEVLAAPFTIDRHELALSASVGVADSTAVGADGRELMRAADVGLYRAKARGRGRVEVHDPRGDAQRVTHHVLATEMAAALAHGELFLEYQPLVTLADDTTRPGASRRCRGGVTPGSASSRRTGSSSWRRRPATPARSAGGC